MTLYFKFLQKEDKKAILFYLLVFTVISTNVLYLSHVKAQH